MLTNGGGFGSKPRALMCYICGREYGTTSLQIHLKTCMKKWEIEESKKPKKERRPMPQPPKQLVDVLNKINGGENVNMNELETYNNKANDEYNDSALIRCDYCNRTFLPERLDIHRKICTPEKPFKPLPPPASKSGNPSSTSNSNNAPVSRSQGGNQASRGGDNSSYGYKEEQPKSNAMGKGVPAKKPGMQAPSKAQYEEYNDDDEDNGYVPAKPTPSKPQAKVSAQPKNQNFGGGGSYADQGGEYENVQLVDCDICGRRFAADRIDRHIKACTKTQKGEAKHAKKVALAEKKQAETEKFIAKEQKYKKNNWRDQHKEFVENLKYNRKLQAVEEKGGDIRSLGPAPKMTSIESNMIECPYCARKFNPQSAEKHINICKNVVNKPKAVPGKGPIPTKTQQGGFGAPTSKPTPTKTSSKFGGTGSYGGYTGDDDYQPSYNPSKYSGGMNESQPKQTGYGAGRTQMPQQATKAGLGSQYGQPNSGRGMTSQYDQGMNSSNRTGFGAKTSSSSLATAGKMAMQDINSYSGTNPKSTKSGYRY